MTRREAREIVSNLRRIETEFKIARSVIQMQAVLGLVQGLRRRLEPLTGRTQSAELAPRATCTGDGLDGIRGAFPP
jgi:hypothetical protein